MKQTLFFAWHYLWARPMGAILNLLLLSLGLASITFLMLIGEQVSRAFERDLAGIDAVVGAKGSPMQLILAGVLHLDAPAGNVPLTQVEAIKEHPLVDQVIPISLGDSFQSFRIVGTSAQYLRHYQATIAQGSTWTQPMQVVLGARVAKQLQLQPGDSFFGSHGLGGGGHQHGESPYYVVGILASHGGVLDRLILTDTTSVWKVHEDHTATDEEDRRHLEQDREVTMALVTYRSPMAALTFPKYINKQTEMQAAAPALEITKLLHMLGLGADVLRAFAGILLLTAGLSVFIGMWNAVRERRADLALLRMLGASPLKISTLLLVESLWLGALASVLGLCFGQILTIALGNMLDLDQTLLVSGLIWPVDLWIVPGLAWMVSVLAASLPTIEAYRVSVLELLQSN
jgi:putative ABC transport system permease protein